MRNPYIIDRPLTDQDLFSGRDSVFALLREHLDAGHRLVALFGRPRIGKTSAINQLSVRLGERYLVHRIDCMGTRGQETDALGMIVDCLADALGLTESVADGLEPVSILDRCLEILNAQPELPIHLVCFDGILAEEFASQGAWADSLQALQSAANESSNLGVLFAIEGVAHDAESTATLAGVARLELGPLDADETEELLMRTVRGSMTYDYEAARRAHALTGGEPLYVQLYGHVLFEQRARSGWVGLSDIDRVRDQVIALGEGQFQQDWDGSTPVTRVVLAAFAEMTGHHGVGSAKDVALYLDRLRVQVPVEQIETALAGLAARRIFVRLGGNTYGFVNGLFRWWLMQHQSTLDAVRQARRRRRAPVRTISPFRNRRIDWTSLILWAVAGLLAVVILLVWRGRELRESWTVEPTPFAEVNESAPTRALPTVEKGVAPGHIAYMLKHEPSDNWQIYAMRSDGSDPVRLTENTANNTSPSWSPDGRRIAIVSDRDGNREIYTMNADGNAQVNVSNNMAEDWTPTWSPDGQQIAFASFRDGNWEIYVMDVGGGNATRLTHNSAADYSPTWSPSGKGLAFVSNRDGNLEIYVMRPDGSDQTRFTNDPATDQSPMWSPDGTQLLWESYREDNMEIFVGNVDGSGLRNVSQDVYADDHGPTWSPWGSQIAFYSNRDSGWDIHTLDLNTGERVNLTLSEDLEQAPSWGP